MQNLFFYFTCFHFFILPNSQNISIDSKILSQNTDELNLCTFDLLNLDTNLSSKNSAAIIDWPRWKTGQIIKIKFLDGDITSQDNVKEFASEWTKYANLTFEYVSRDEYADIRIAFNLGKPGAWSALGMNSTSVTTDYQNRPSMRLGPVIKNETSKRTVLHEFGHALGLIHETTNPAATIKWNFPKVYQYYYDIMGLSKEDVDNFVINKRNVTNYSEYDPLSIMHYYIPASLTTNGVGVNQMSVLSKTDISSISTWYPYPLQSIIKSGERIDLIPSTRAVKSSNGLFILNFKKGVLSILDVKNQEIIWKVGTTYPSLATKTSAMLEDGNLVIRRKGIKIKGLNLVTWRSSSEKYIGEAYLELQNDGNLVLFHDEIPYWSSKKGKL